MTVSWARRKAQFINLNSSFHWIYCCEFFFCCSTCSNVIFSDANNPAPTKKKQQRQQQQLWQSCRECHSPIAILFSSFNSIYFETCKSCLFKWVYLIHCVFFSLVFPFFASSFLFGEYKRSSSWHRCNVHLCYQFDLLVWNLLYAAKHACRSKSFLFSFSFNNIFDRYSLCSRIIDWIDFWVPRKPKNIEHLNERGTKTTNTDTMFYSKLNGSV